MMPLLGTETTGSYAGYPMYEFTIDGCPCKIVVPPKPLPGRQWVWKSEFFEAFPKFELAMVERGYYLVFMSVGNTFGCPSAMRHFDEFYRHLVEERGFHRRAVLLGLSRGGLYCYNWAAGNTDKVACIYADNAVCDFKSWPGGKGVGPGSPDDWAKLQKDYGFTSEAEALAWKFNPVDNLAPLAKAGIPLIHATRTEDTVVSATENTDVLERNYRALGGSIKVFRHHGDHHPHGLDDPTPLIEYLESVRL